MKMFRRILIVFLLLIIALQLPLEGFAYRSIYKSFLSIEPHKIELIGKQKGEQFGSSLASGDINGDGIDDLIIGSPFYSSEGMTWNGKISVFYGNFDLTQRVYDMKNDSADLVVYGRYSGDQLGTSIASGDFNDDGYDDILMGAYNAQSGSGRPGKAFLVLGQEDFEDRGITLGTLSANIEFVGDNDGDSFGMSVYVDDINHDNIEDILIGAPFSVSSDGVRSGNVYGYYGSSFDVDSVDRYKKFFGEKDCDVIFQGKSEGERFGSAIAVGDLVGGQYKDLIVSAYFADGPKGPQTGKVYVFKGEKEYPKFVSKEHDILIGENSYDWFGFSLDISKVDNSTKEDLLISAFPYLNRKSYGRAYLLYGRTNFTDKSKSEEFFYVTPDSADLYFEGGSGENFMGANVALGDIDGDRLGDFVIGAPGISTPKSVEEGEIYVFYQRLIGEQTHFDIKNDELSSYVFGENNDDWFGAKIKTLDFNNDSYMDIVVSSRYSDRHDSSTGLVSESDNGKVYILLGHDRPFGDMSTLKEPGDDYVTRGEFVQSVVDGFDVKESRKDFIDNCYAHREFCFFAFTGQSNFGGIRLEPNIVLYPDVPYGSKYYEPVTIATMLGLLNGFINEEETPFRPDDHITRIQALKVILGLNRLVDYLYQFELVEALGGITFVENQWSYYDDITPQIPHMWWYPRFANYAYEHDLVEEKKFFMPDDYITKSELEVMIDKTLEHITNGFNT